MEELHLLQSNDDNAHFFTPRSMYPKQKGGDFKSRLICSVLILLFIRFSLMFILFFLYFYHRFGRWINLHQDTLFQLQITFREIQTFCFCQYKSKKNLLLIRKKHHCFHPVMLPANNLIQFMLFLLCRKCHPSSSLSPYVLVHK